MAFAELSRRHGDFAVIGLAAHGKVADGVFSDLRLVFFSAGDRPILARTAAAYGAKVASRARVVELLREGERVTGAVVDDLDAARAMLAERADCTGRIGVAGFCMGGGFALVMGTKGFDASAPFYPSPMREYGFLTAGTCPVVASYGRRDILNIGTAPRLKETLDRAGVDNDVKVYPEVGHSFANELAAQPLLRIVGFGHDAAVTDDAYRRVFDFFGAHLAADR